MAGNKHLKDDQKAAQSRGWQPAQIMGLARALQKAGHGTRQKTTEMVTLGRVMVGEEVIKDPAFMVGPDSDIHLDKKPLALVQPAYFAFHKPARVVCVAVDGPDRRKVADYLPPDIPGLSTVGRMDTRTTGLILVSNDTPWRNALAKSKDLEQEYRIQVEGELSEMEISVISAGIHMPNLGIFRPVSVKIVEKLNRHTVIQMVTKGSKARAVRRMFNTLRHEITLLRRIRIGDVRLGSLPSGGLRKLNPNEVASVKKLAGRTLPDG